MKVFFFFCSALEKVWYHSWPQRALRGLGGRMWEVGGWWWGGVTGGTGGEHRRPPLLLPPLLLLTPSLLLTALTPHSSSTPYLP